MCFSPLRPANCLPEQVTAELRNHHGNRGISLVSALANERGKNNPGVRQTPGRRCRIGHIASVFGRYGHLSGIKKRARRRVLGGPESGTDQCRPLIMSSTTFFASPKIIIDLSM